MKRLVSFFRKPKHIVLAVIAVLIIVAAAYGIATWTRTIKVNRAEKAVRDAMDRVLNEKGEKGLLEMVNSVSALNENSGSSLLSALGYDSSDILRANELENIDIYEKYNKAVVNITTQRYQYNAFLEAVPESGTGSGFFIDTAGHIVTNYHVIEGADVVYVYLYDGSSYTGSIVGTDKENDLAVIKIDLGEKEPQITTIDFGSSEHLKVGQKVLAIGNPFGYDRTLTTGIVSGLGRPVKTDDGLVIMGMIQTDASINPGNSGGPLLDSGGKLIGINSSIYTTSGGSVGIGFAVPVDTAKRVIPELIDHGKVVRGWLDVVPVQLDSRIIKYAGLNVTGGLLVSRVQEGGKAEKAGIRGGTQKVRYGTAIIYLGGDIITEVDGVETNAYADLFTALEDNKPGDIVDVKVLRNGTSLDMKVELTARPEQYEWN